MKTEKSIVLYAFLSVMTACTLALSYDIIPVSKYPGDLNSDGMVDYNDLFIFASRWLQSPGDPNADIAPNCGDGIVNFLDFSVLAKDWGENSALDAARSGYDCAKYLATTVTGLPSTGNSVVSSAEVTTVWNTFCSYVQAQKPGGQTVPAPTRFTDANGSGDQLVTAAISCGEGDVRFILRFYRYDSDSNTIKLESIGIYDGISKKITVDLKILKSAEVLMYAIASKPRVWVTGDSTIHGNIYSAWQYQNLSPFNITADSTVEGTINTILTNINPSTGQSGPDLYADKFDSHGNPVYDANGNRVQIKMPYDLETLDANGNPMYDSDGNKIVSPTDEIQGQYYSINYDVNYGDKAVNMPGMKISDYNTSQYKTQTTTLSTSGVSTVTEYFPHAAGNYSQPSSSGSQRVSRYKYENQTLSNIKVSAYAIRGGTLKGTLFKNCTFNGILYLDCGLTGNTYNNVRFENCTFNGPIITNTPNYSNSTNWWMRNCLYFTGAETFQNETDIPATILAPNFNVNLGNTNPNGGENNVLTGAIVGGIVDIRGNAQVCGTIISMFDTSMYVSGYVSNIGVTVDDGGSETTDPGDIGVINITPDPDKMLPSGITAPIVIKPLQNTYRESE